MWALIPSRIFIILLYDSVLVQYFRQQ